MSRKILRDVGFAPIGKPGNHRGGREPVGGRRVAVARGFLIRPPARGPGGQVGIFSMFRAWHNRARPLTSVVAALLLMIISLGVGGSATADPGNGHGNGAANANANAAPAAPATAP